MGKRKLYPKDRQLARWARAICGLYRQAADFSHPPERRPEKQRRRTQLVLEERLLALCRPWLDGPSASQAKLCRRMEKHIREPFVFVAEPRAPPDNNAAERNLRPLATSRKVSGGTRSPRARTPR